LERFWVSQGALLIRNNKCLILQDAINPDKWMFPGGRIDIGEAGDVAFARELKEELGLEKFEWFGVVGYRILYTPDRHIPVCAIVNLIVNDDDEIKLSDEHAQYRWVGLEEIDKYKFVNPGATELIRKGFEMRMNAN